MERRQNIIPFILFLVLIIMTLYTPAIPPILYLVIIAAVIVGVVVISRRRVRVPSGIPQEVRGFPFQSPKLGIGRWIVIPIAIAGVVLFIFFANWWLDLRLFSSMYTIKAGIDWWKIAYLDNYYFYACIAVGLIVALSDPRIVIEKDIEGNRRFYLHSKFWVMVNAILGQISEYEGSPIPISVTRRPYGDRLSVKRGLLWKLVEFLFGALVLGPIVAQSIALGYLMIAKWIETQQITWFTFLQNCVAVLNVRLFSPEAIPLGMAPIELGEWLIANSVVFEFLLWLRTPVLIFVGLWCARLVISGILEVREGRIYKFFRNMVGVGLLLLIPYVLQIPTQAFDVTTPFYVRTVMIAIAVLAAFLIFLSLRSGWVQLGIIRIFRSRVILLSLILIISGSLLYGPVVVAFQYAPAMQGNWKEYLWNPKYLPNVVYTRWATGLESIKEDDIDSAINTGTNLEILRRIRVFNDEAAMLRLKPSIGVNWMDFPQTTLPVDIIYANGREYWVSALTIVQPSGGTSDDQWRSSRLLITHSERILAIDAATGEVVPITSVFNISDSYSLYYGEGGLFASSPVVYPYPYKPDAKEIHLPDYTGPESYGGEFDYVLTGFERLWFFSGLYGREQPRWDFGGGQYGDVNMLFMRDVNMRLSQILLPGMTLDDDPYLVSDGSNVYYSMYVYIDRGMPTEYLDYPYNEDSYWRTFATVLVNAYDGSIEGYFVGNEENNYVLDFYRAMYPTWDQPVPDWLQSQLRYPEFLFERQIDSYNTYHVSNPDFWQQSTDFFELTTDAAGKAIEDTRYVIFYLNGTTHWAAVRLVEYFGGAGKNLAGMYVALNGEEFGDVSLLRTGTIAVIGPQTALEAINNYGPTKELLTLTNWQSGNVLMYVINNRPYYFVPYYGGTATTLAPAMNVVVDAMSQKVGYYRITDPGDANEVGLASERAYFNLIGSTIELPAEARKAKVLDEFTLRGYAVKSPQELSPDVSYQENTTSYYIDADWAEVDVTMTDLLATWAEPYSVNTIVWWETEVSNVKYLYVGVLVSEGGIVELHYLTVAYG